MAASLANLDEIEEKGLLGHVRDEAGPALEAGLRELGGHPAVADVRACKLLGALELVRPAKVTPAALPSLGARLTELVREEGAIVRGIRDCIAISPPMIITREELGVLLSAVRRGLDRLHESLGR
jgi:adenosylmethionine-8-amino-7-oxononanoate aminotransferase